MIDHRVLHVKSIVVYQPVAKCIHGNTLGRQVPSRSYLILSASERGGARAPSDY